MDAAGQVVDSLGGRGSGPGEFEAIHALSIVDVETLVAIDQTGLRITWMDLQGDVVSSQTISPLEGRVGSMFALGESALFLVEPLPLRFRGMRGQAASPRVQVRAAGVDPWIIATVDGIVVEQIALGGALPSPKIFAPFALMTVVGSTVVVGSSDRYALRVLNRKGVVVDSIIGDVQGRRVEEDEKRMILDAMAGDPVDDQMIRDLGLDKDTGWERVPLQQRRDLIAKLEVDDRFPAVTKVLPGPGRTLLVRLGYGSYTDSPRYQSESARWDVYEMSPVRRVGSLITPSDIQFLYGHNGWIAGFEADQLGAPILRVMRIRRSGHR